MDGTIFISHARSDTAYVKRLEVYLANHGLRCIADHSPRAGQRSAEFVAGQIDQCAAVVVVMTPAARVTPSVTAAVTHALAHNIAVVPLLRAGTPFDLLAGHHYEEVLAEQLPSALLVERLRSLSDVVGDYAGSPPIPGDVRVDGLVVDRRSRLGETVGWSSVLVLASVMGLSAISGWSAWLGSRYGVAAGMALMVAAMAVGMRWPVVAVASAWVSAALATALLVTVGVTWWQISVEHQATGWSPLVGAAVAAIAWPLSSARLARILVAEAGIKRTAREHELARQRVVGRLWLTDGEPPSMFGKLLKDHVRGLRTTDVYFRYALAANASVVFVDTSGLTRHPDLTATATTLAAWAKSVRGLGHSVNVTAAFVAVDETVPAMTVLTAGDVDIIRVPVARFALTVGPLLERGYPALYMPLLTALLKRAYVPPTVPLLVRALKR